MADKKKIAIQLSLDVDKQGAVSQVKNVAEQMKKILTSFEKSGGSFEIFNDLVGYLKAVEEQCLRLKNINPLKFDELFGKQGGVDLNSAISSQVVGILDTAKQVPEVIEGIQNKINNLGKQNSIKIADVRKVGNDIKDLYTLMGQTPNVDLDFANKKGSFDQLNILSDALKDFKVNWLDFVNTVKNNPNPLDDKGKVTGSGESPEVSAINQKIEELKAQKKGLGEISNAISGEKIKFVFNSKDEMLPQLKELVAEFKKAEEAKTHIEQFEYTSSDKYLDAVKKYIHAAKLLVAARDAVPYNDENSAAYKYISVGDDSDIMEKADMALTRIKKKQDKNITESVIQKILDTVKQEIKDIDSEIKQLQNDRKDVIIKDKSNVPNSRSIDDGISKYKELKEALLEYKEASKIINFDDDATDTQIDEAFKRQDELVEKIKNLIHIDSEKLDSILLPFGQDQNADVETVYQNIVSALETDIPNAAQVTANTMSSMSNKIIDKANKISEAIKNVFKDASNIEFNARNGIANGQETMNLFGSDGSVSVANGTDYQVDTDSLVQQVVANLNKNIIMSLHNHANGDMAFSPSDINSFAKLYYGQGTKINGIIANGIIQTIDFNNIGQDVAINIAKDYQEGIKHLFEAENISQYASITDDGIVPSDFLKQIQLKSTEKYQEIISQLQEAMTIVLRQSFEKNGADFTLQAFSVDDIEKLTTYLTNVQESANNAIAPVEKLKNLIATLRPDINLNEFADIFDKFKNGAIDGTQALSQILGAASEVQNQVDQLKMVTEALQEFAALKNEILGKAASSEGGSMDDASIGKYTERITIAKEKLDELAKQSLLTAEQVKEANDIYETAIGNLENKQRTNNTHLEDLEGREPQGSYNDGYDRGYYDAKNDFNIELDNLRKQLDAAEAELNHAKTSIDSGASIDTSVEVQNLENLRAKLEVVKNAISTKTEAFKDEGAVVDSVVSNEIKLLDKLKSDLMEISQTVSNMGEINLNTKSIELDPLLKAAQSQTLREFMSNASLSELKLNKGINSNESAENYWREARYKKDVQFFPISRKDADSIVSSKIPDNLIKMWYWGRDIDTDIKRNDPYAGHDLKSKIEIESLILGDDELRNAAINKMWYNYNQYNNKNQQGFFDFINTPREVYRGQDKDRKLDSLPSFTFSEQEARYFSDNIIKQLIKPRDTVGFVGPSNVDREQEVWIRNSTDATNITKNNTDVNLTNEGNISELQNEQQILLSLEQTILKVKDAIGAKTQAFVTEKETVASVVSEEIDSLTKLKEYIDSISQSVSALINGKLVNMSDKVTGEIDKTKDIGESKTDAPQVVDSKKSQDTSSKVNMPEDEKLLSNILTEVQKIAGAMQDDGALSGMKEPLNQIAQKLDRIINGESERKNTSKLPSGSANTRLADAKQYDQIKEIALGAVSDKGTESKITGMKALADGLVQVNGYIKTAEGNYENFTVKVNEANETIGLAFSENKKLTQQMQQEANAQEAFSNNFNLIADEFVKYTESIDQSDQVTAKFSSQIQQMENRLAAVSNGAELDAWRADWDKLTASIEKAKQEQQKLALEAQKRQDTGVLNAIDKSVKETYRPFKTTASKMAPELEEIQKKYKEIDKAITEYKGKSEALTQEEINGLKQLEVELQKLTQEYTRKMQAQQKQDKDAKNAYGASQVKNISNKYEHLSGVASGAEFADSANIQAALSNLKTAYDNLIAKQKEFKDGSPAEGEKQKFAQLTDQYNQAYKALDNMIKSSRKLQGEGVGDPYEIVSGTNIGDQNIRIQELQNAVNLFSNGTVKVGQFNAACTELSYTVKNADGTFTEFTAVLDSTGTKIVNVAGKTKESTSLFKSAFDSLKKKSKEILTYMTSMGVMTRVIGQIKQGIQYVKDIDSALTELKKVTDETDETYAKFLNTMAQTGASVGATTSDLTNMAANWSRLGSIIKSAPLCSNA